MIDFQALDNVRSLDCENTPLSLNDLFVQDKSASTPRKTRHNKEE